MKVGRQRRRLKLQRQTMTQDEYGQPLNTWAEVASRMVEVLPLNGREFFSASGENSDINVKISVRYDASVASGKPEDRWVDDTVSPPIVFDIQAPINVGDRNREIVFMCKQQ